jgi:hypothetical protein
VALISPEVPQGSPSIPIRAMLECIECVECETPRQRNHLVKQEIVRLPLQR